MLVSPDEHGLLAGLWAAAAAIGEGKLQPCFDIQAQALTCALILGIAQAGAGPLPVAAEPPGPGAGDIATRIAVRYIHDNLDRPISLAEVAAYVHVSPRHLSRLFARAMGCAPAEYIEGARLDLAQVLLLRTAKPLKEIAAQVGYADVQHFTRVFSRTFGVPPGGFRQRGAAVDVPNRQKRGMLV